MEALSVLLVASRLTERGVLYGLLRLAHDTPTLATPSANAKYEGEQKGRSLFVSS